MRFADSKKGQAGLSLVELLVVMGILAVLAALIVPSYHHFKRQAEKATCLSHMKSVHAGLGNHWQDKGYWPQMPAEMLEADESKFFEFWIKSLEPYGVSQANWLCPTDKIDPEKWEENKTGSYIPCAFDARHATPHRWNQPWLMERGNNHGQGAHIAMPDGSIFPSMKPFEGIR
ncbi:MAG: prepilin-type N-terminal cleavage/methylation domain-containing protein [Verrucomicrobiales bacterium]|nr:prepilin-type N-terminal cleavage/methylation domain-containing protein [Verrucomicrobiales bacterium]